MRWGFWPPIAVAVVACSTSHLSDGTTMADSGAAGPSDAGGGGDDAPPIDAASLFTGLAPFQDIAAAAGLPSAGGMCLVSDDFDGDGKPDIFVATFAGPPPQTMTLFLNDGAAHFKPMPVAPIKFTGQGTSLGWCAAGDFDGDGRLDVALASFLGFEVHILKNMGGGAFADALTLTAPLGDLSYSGIAVADFDGDGWLDLFVAPYTESPLMSQRDCAPQVDGYACVVPGPRCQPPPIVFRNSGTSAIGFLPPTSVTDASACGPANTNALAITDWNGDGRPDVFVANDWGTNRLYLNGMGAPGASPAFSDVFPGLGAKAYNSGMGAAFEDFDFDGQLDLYVSDMGSDQFYLGSGGHLVAHNREWGVSQPTRLHSGWAPLAEDFDSDGFPDVYVASAAFVGDYDDLATVGNGGQLQERVQYDVLLQNQGGHAFAARGVPQTTASEPFSVFGATAVADFDGDGRLDIAEAIGYPVRFELLHNMSPSQHWIDVRLSGKSPNVDGIGATVTLGVAGKPPWKRLVQRSRGSNGSSWAALHFGLGQVAAIDHIDVQWPDGTTQTVPAPPADALLTIRKP